MTFQVYQQLPSPPRVGTTDAQDFHRIGIERGGFGFPYYSEFTPDPVRGVWQDASQLRNPQAERHLHTHVRLTP